MEDQLRGADLSVTQAGGRVQSKGGLSGHSQASTGTPHESGAYGTSVG